MHLGGISQDGPRFGRDIELQANVLRERILDDAFQILQQMPGLNLDPHSFQTACEGEHLPDNVRPPFGTDVDRVEDEFRIRIGAGEMEQVDRHHDRGQDVVQIMRDTSGQGSDALHPLSAQELGLDFLLFGNVGVDGQDRFGPPLIIPDQRPAGLNGDLPVIPGEMLDFTLPFAPADGEFIDFPELSRLRIDQVSHIPAGSLLAGPAIHPFGPLVPEKHVSVQITDKNRIAGFVKKGGLFGDSLLGLFPLGHVADHAQQIAIGHLGRDDLGFEGRSVLAAEGPFPVIFGFGLDRVDRQLDFGLLLRHHDIAGVQADQFLPGVAQHPAHARVGIQIGALGIGNDDAVRRVFKESPVAQLAGPLRFFRSFSLGNVPEGPDATVVLPIHAANGG